MAVLAKFEFAHLTGRAKGFTLNYLLFIWSSLVRTVLIRKSITSLQYGNGFAQA
jgi:hypothetical protein